MTDEFYLKMPDFHVTFRDLLQAVSHVTSPSITLFQFIPINICHIPESDLQAHAVTKQPQSVTSSKQLYCVRFKVCLRFEILKLMMKITLFWDMTPCSLITISTFPEVLSSAAGRIGSPMTPSGIEPATFRHVALKRYVSKKNSK